MPFIKEKVIFLTGEGIVVKVYGDRATVRIKRESACSGECHSCGGCTDKSFIAEAENKAGASEGDRVKLYLPTGKVYFYAFAVYMVPVLILMLTVGICRIADTVNLYAVLFAIALFVIWFIWIRRYNKKEDIKNVITEIIK